MANNLKNENSSQDNHTPRLMRWLKFTNGRLDRPDV